MEGQASQDGGSGQEGSGGQEVVGHFWPLVMLSRPGGEGAVGCVSGRGCPKGVRGSLSGVFAGGGLDAPLQAEHMQGSREKMV